MNRRFLRFPAVKAKTGKSKTSIYKEISEGSFPRPISIGPRSVAFLEEEVELWMTKRIAASRTGIST